MSVSRPVVAWGRVVGGDEQYRDLGVGTSGVSMMASLPGHYGSP
jgi:hypothetical protein